MRSRIWQLHLAAGLVASALYALVPPFAGSSLVMNLLGLSPAVAIVAGLRLHRPASARPWAWFAIGFAFFWLGDLYTYGYPQLTGEEVGIPSLGDASYIAVYPALMAGLLILVRCRTPVADRAGAVDSLIVTLGLTVISWVALIAPYLEDDELGIAAKLVSVAYPLGDVLLLAAAVRLAMDTGRREPAFHLMATAIVALLVTDFAYGLATLHGTYAGQLSLDLGWIAFYLLWGTAALHPSMAGLEQAGGNHEAKLTPGRLALLTAA